MAPRPAHHAALPASLRVLERGWLSCNSVVLLDDAGSASLIDTGHMSHAAQTAALVELALDGRRLERIFNTHLHSDHCGGNAALAARWGARIAIPPGQAQAVRDWDEDALSYTPTGQSCPRFAADELLAPASRFAAGGLDWEVIAAPGHDPHSVMFWCAAAGVLASADVLWEHGFGAIFPELEGESGFAEQAAMLERIESLAPQVVIPGHGAVFTDVAAALARARARLAALSADPARNARNAARALLKFHLLTVQRTRRAELLQHLAGARYFATINARYFELEFADFVGRIVDDLVAAGVARVQGEFILNHEAHAGARS